MSGPVFIPREPDPERRFETQDDLDADLRLIARFVCGLTALVCLIALCFIASFLGSKTGQSLTLFQHFAMTIGGVFALGGFLAALASIPNLP